MIPRYQKILFVILLVASLVMSGLLWKLRDRAHRRLVAGEDSAPTEAPQVAAAEQATLMVADDGQNSLRAQAESLPLPADEGARARVILGKLLSLYASPDSAHPVPGADGAVQQVFLLPVPPAPSDSNPNPAVQTVSAPQAGGPELAVVNLKGAFAAAHPSGLETESLTVLSICGTLHANLPHVTQVRFLVDGLPRTTLAGHADLTRTYLTEQVAPASGAQ